MYHTPTDRVKKEEESILSETLLNEGDNPSKGMTSTRNTSRVMEMVRSSSLGKLTQMEVVFTICINES